MNASTLAVYTNGSSRSSNKIGNEVLQGGLSNCRYKSSSSGSSSIGQEACMDACNSIGNRSKGLQE